MQAKTVQKVGFLLLGMMLLSLVYVQLNTTVYAGQNDDNPYEWVGQAHNEGVLYLFEHIPEPPPSQDELEALVKHYGREFIVLSGYPNPPGPVYSPLLDELSSLVADYDGRSLQALQQDILALEQQAAMELEGEELATLQIAASITRYSARLWTPTQHGGMGAGDLPAAISPQVIEADKDAFIEMYNASGSQDHAIEHAFNASFIAYHKYR